MMNLSPEEFLETGLLEQYALGLLSEEEASEVADYISKHPQVMSLYDELQDTMYNLAESHGITPPDRVKTKVMENISTTTDISNTTKSISWLPHLSTAAAILLGLSTLFYYNIVTNLDKQLKTKSAEYAQLENDCELTKKTLDSQNKIYAFYKDTNTESAVLKGNEKLPKFEVVSRYNKSKSQLILDTNSRYSIGNDKMLCLWGDIDGEMILIAKINESTQGEIIDFSSDMTSLNVTLEDLKEEIDHPDVSQLVASVSI